MCSIVRSDPLVKWLRHHPFTVVSWVRIPYGSLFKAIRSLRVVFFVLKSSSTALQQCRSFILIYPYFPGNKSYLK